MVAGGCAFPQTGLLSASPDDLFFQIDSILFFVSFSGRINLRFLSSPLQNHLDLQPYFAVRSALQGSKIAFLT
jgi:hypothetical protein